MEEKTKNKIKVAAGMVVAGVGAYLVGKVIGIERGYDLGFREGAENQSCWENGNEEVREKMLFSTFHKSVNEHTKDILDKLDPASHEGQKFMITCKNK